MPELAGKSALVTGGAGTSASSSRACWRAKAPPSRSPTSATRERLERLAGELQAGGAEAIGITADVTREDDCERMVARRRRPSAHSHRRRQRRRRRARRAHLRDLRRGRRQHRRGHSFTGAFLTAKHAAIAMMPQRAGKIIFVSSRDGLRAEPYTGAYNAAKHGLHGLMKTLAIELGPHPSTSTRCARLDGLDGRRRSRPPLVRADDGQAGSDGGRFRRLPASRFVRASWPCHPGGRCRGVLWLASERSSPRHRPCVAHGRRAGSQSVAARPRERAPALHSSRRILTIAKPVP